MHCYVKRTVETFRVIGTGSDVDINLSSGYWEILPRASAACIREDGHHPVKDVVQEQFLPMNEWFEMYKDDRDIRLALCARAGYAVYFRRIEFVPLPLDKEIQ